MKFLAPHYRMERLGHETFVARAVKTVARKAYYHGMARYCTDRPLVDTLQQIDEEVRRAKRICPYPIEKPARKFLVTGRENELGERMRLLREVVFGIRARSDGFVLYTFDMGAAIATEMQALSRSLTSLEEGSISEYHAHIYLISSMSNTSMPVVRTFSDMFDYPDFGTVHGMQTIPCKIESVSQFFILLGLNKP